MIEILFNIAAILFMLWFVSGLAAAIFSSIK